MQKKLPTYTLERIKKAFDDADKLRMTLSARKTINDLEFSDDEVVDIIQALSLDDFYKSMPPRHESFTAWQDVYKPRYRKIDLYIKFQINLAGELIVSFKKK